MAELVGIIGALYALLTTCSNSADVVLHVDSKNAISHVCEGEPTEKSGRMLLPLIRMARCILAGLRGKRIQVRLQWIPREYNEEHRMAKLEQRRGAPYGLE